MQDLAALALVPEEGAFDRLLERAGKTRFVLLGESTHGTHEFYRDRALLTRRLVEEHGFDAVAIEADWPDAHRVSRFVRRQGLDRTAEESLAGFRRFPQWMWRNAVMRDFVRTLFELNLRRPSPVGVYGLDLYSLQASTDVVVDCLRRIDRDAAERARARYACFDHYDRHLDGYAYAGLGLMPSCEAEVTAELLEARARVLGAIQREDAREEEVLFQVEQNARLVKSAEEYYRTMLRGAVPSWNLRDRHMADTLDAVAAHLDRRLGRPSKIVVWAHNSHLGDARATQMGEEGELNVGQLVRERHGASAFLVGFTTFAGSVTAAQAWDGKAESMTVRDALPGSHEHVLHEVARRRGGTLVFPEMPAILGERRLERAIGVVYRPKTERASHWFEARLADQFDALVHVDRTTAVAPIEKRPQLGKDGEAPETFPTGV